MFVTRYLDIFLGLLLLLAMLSLLYGSYNKSSIFIIMFLASSLGVVVVYWSWYLYNKYADTDYPVFEEQVRETVRISIATIDNCRLGRWAAS